MLMWWLMTVSHRVTFRATAVFTPHSLPHILQNNQTECWAWQLHTNGVRYNDKLRTVAVLCNQWFDKTDLLVAWQPISMSFWAHYIRGHTANKHENINQPQYHLATHMKSTQTATTIVLVDSIYNYVGIAWTCNAWSNNFKSQNMSLGNIIMPKCSFFLFRQASSKLCDLSLWFSHEAAAHCTE